MAKARHYSPQISRFLVTVLYHEAKRHRMPMTKLVDRLLIESLHRLGIVETARSGIIQENSVMSPEQ